MKTAICQVADTGPLESLAMMLEYAGYECLLPNQQLKGELRRLGCSVVLDIDNIVKKWGYEYPKKMREAGPEVDVICSWRSKRREVQRRFGAGGPTWR